MEVKISVLNGIVVGLITLFVATEFSTTPGPRYQSQGPHSGEQFREKVLVPALRQHKIIKIVLDGTEGYGSSFIDEAFGGLVREHDFDKADLLARIKIVSEDDPLLSEDVRSAINYG